MAGVYAPDGSLRVSLSDNSPTLISSEDGSGVYARDGSYRVTLVGSEGSVSVVTDSLSLEIPVTGSYVDTVTFSVSDGIITGIVLS